MKGERVGTNSQVHKVEKPTLNPIAEKLHEQTYTTFTSITMPVYNDFAEFRDSTSLEHRLTLLEDSSKETLLNLIAKEMITALKSDFYEQIQGLRECGSDITIMTKTGVEINFGDFFRKYDFVPKISLEVQFREEGN